MEAFLITKDNLSTTLSFSHGTIFLMSSIGCLQELPSSKIPLILPLIQMRKLRHSESYLPKITQ